MKKILEKLKNEPVFVGQVLAALVNAAVVFFAPDLSSGQLATLFGAIHVIAGGGSRAFVSPARKEKVQQ